MVVCRARTQWLILTENSAKSRAGPDIRIGDLTESEGMRYLVEVRKIGRDQVRKLLDFCGSRVLYLMRASDASDKRVNIDGMLPFSSAVARVQL